MPPEIWFLPRVSLRLNRIGFLRGFSSPDQLLPSWTLNKSLFLCRWSAYLCLPLVALLFPLIFVFAPIEVYDRFVARRNSQITARYYLPTVVFTLSLIFQTTAQSLLSIFRCYQVDDKSYLWADFGVRCDDAYWYTAAGFAFFGTVLCELAVSLAV